MRASRTEYNCIKHSDHRKNSERNNKRNSHIPCTSAGFRTSTLRASEAFILLILYSHCKALFSKSAYYWPSRAFFSLHSVQKYDAHIKMLIITSRSLLEMVKRPLRKGQPIHPKKSKNLLRKRNRESLRKKLIFNCFLSTNFLEMSETWAELEKAVCLVHPLCKVREDTSCGLKRNKIAVQTIWGYSERNRSAKWAKASYASNHGRPSISCHHSFRTFAKLFWAAKTIVQC